MENQLNVTCECHVNGYEWSSKFGLCVDINECTSGVHNCSLESGESCFNLPGSFKCVCGFGLIRNKQVGGCIVSDTFKIIQDTLEPVVNNTQIENILSTLVDTLTRSTAHTLNNFSLFPFGFIYFFFF